MYKVKKVIVIGVLLFVGLLPINHMQAMIPVCEMERVNLTTTLSYDLPPAIFSDVVCASGRVILNVRVDNSEMCGWTLYASEGIWLVDGAEHYSLLNLPTGGASNFGRLTAGEVLALEFPLPQGFDNERQLKLLIRAGVYSWEAPKGEFRLSVWHGARLFLTSRVDRANRICRLDAQLPPEVKAKEFRWSIEGAEPVTTASASYKLRLAQTAPFNVKVMATLLNEEVHSASVRVEPHAKRLKPPLEDGEVLVGLCFYEAKPDDLKSEEELKKTETWLAPRLTEARHSIDYVRLMQQEELGNLAVFWPNAPGVPVEDECRLISELADEGIYTMSIYQHRSSENVAKMRKAGRDVYFLNNNIGEYASYLYQDISSANACGIPQEGNLKDCHDYFVDRYVSDGLSHIQRSYPYIFSTSGAVLANYELEAGIEFMSGELYAIGAQNLAYSTSEMRGAARKWKPEFWAGWLAQEWQSTQVPYQSEQKFHLLKAGLYQQYMMGTSIIVLESGSQTTQAGYHTVESGKVNFAYDHEIPRRYRQTMKEFYDFVKKKGRRAKGTPQSHIALVQGNYDCYIGIYVDWFVPWAQYKSAEENSNWRYGDPELSSLAAQQLFFPLPGDALHPYSNLWLAGTPYGQTDIVGVNDLTRLDDLKRYQFLVYSGWNTMTKTILDLLSDYVEQGGTLLLALPHLSTRLDREYYDYQISDLIGGGNLAPLINVKVSGFHTFGKAAKQSSWLSNTEVARVELGQGVDVVKNEGGYPLLVRQKHGKGSVNLLLTRAYPGRKELASFYKKIVGDMAEQFKGGVFIDSDYATRSYINYAVYGDRVYLLNIDGQNSHTFNLILGSEKKKITLTPCEFQVVYYSHSDKL